MNWDKTEGTELNSDLIIENMILSSQNWVQANGSRELGPGKWLQGIGSSEMDPGYGYNIIKMTVMYIKTLRNIHIYSLCLVRIVRALRFTATDRQQETGDNSLPVHKIVSVF